MKESKENILVNEFEKIDDLIKRSDITEFISDDEIMNDNVVVEEFEDSNIDSFPGSLKLRMDPMKINLFMDFKAPYNSSSKITIKNIKDMIAEYGEYCSSQVDFDVLRDIYKRIIVEGEIISEVVIAKGTRAIAQVPEHITLRSGLNYNSNLLHFVKKEEYLGDIIPETPGIPGMNLYGEEIPFSKAIINNLKLGNNVYLSDNKIYSAIDGTFKIVKEKINVEPCLTISSDVDSITGDLDFNGDIVIEKTVREGFSIKSKGHIYVKESIEPSNITCGDNLIVNKDILGSKNCFIQCKGSVRATYTKEATIKSIGSVYVDREITGSKIYSLDKLITTEKGAIIGGVYFIQNGVITGDIGNESGVESHVIVGVDYQVEDRLKKIQFTIIEIMIEMDKLQKTLKTVTSREKKEEIKNFFLSLRKRMYSLNNYSRNLLKKLDRNENSTVDVYGTVYPGTYIEICHISLFINKPLTKVRFFLDKSNGKINWKYL